MVGGAKPYSHHAQFMLCIGLMYAALLALLCKLSEHISEVACYDVVGTPGVAADLSHCPTRASVTGDLPAAGAWPR